MIEIAYSDEETKKFLNGQTTNILHTYNPVVAATNIALNYIYQDKKVLLIAKDKDLIEIKSLLDRYNLEPLYGVLGNLSYDSDDDYLVSYHKTDYNDKAIKELNNFYKKPLLKDVKSILIDSFFYDTHFNDLTLHCIDGLDKKYLNNMYNKFEYYSDYFANMNIFKNPFVYSNSQNTDIEHLKASLEFFASFVISDNIKVNEVKDYYFSMLVDKKYDRLKNDTSFIETGEIKAEYINYYKIPKTLLDANYKPYKLQYTYLELKKLYDNLLVYQQELDYDDYFYEVDLVRFIDYLKYQLANISQVKHYNKLNEMFAYFNNIGANELIPYVKKGNLKKIVSVLDRSIVKYELSLLKKPPAFYTIKEQLEDYYLYNSELVLNKQLKKVFFMNHSLNMKIDSRLKKYLVKKRFNSFYLEYKPLILGTKYVKNDYDLVIDLTAKSKHSDLLIVFEKPRYLKDDKLSKVIESVFNKHNLNTIYDREKGLYLINNDYYNIDAYLQDSTIYAGKIKAISLLDLGYNYQKEIKRLKQEKQLVIPKQEKVKMKHSDLLFPNYIYYDKRFNSNKIKDLKKLIKKIISCEGPITKKELIKRIKSLSNYKVNQGFLKAVDNILYANYNKRNNFFYKEIGTFRIRDYQYLTDIFDLHLESFLKTIIANSFQLNLIELKKLLRFYLKVRIKKEDDEYLLSILKKYKEDEINW